jgi:hypothetical protein
MSTTFDIFPESTEIPSFRHMMEYSTTEFHRFLMNVDIRHTPRLRFRLFTKEGDEEHPIDITDPFTWIDEYYLWIQVDMIAGGTDGYFWENDEIDYEYWRDDIIPMERCQGIRDHLERCLLPGYHWNFRRSAGQPGCINILYGIVSGCLATLTNGVVYSDDSAWDYQRMPMLGKEFLDTYFDPQKETNAETRDMALRSIQRAHKELSEGFA